LNCSFIKAKEKLMSKLTISEVWNEDPTILATYVLGQKYGTSCHYLGLEPNADMVVVLKHYI
jgi:hypothetical protein